MGFGCTPAELAKVTAMIRAKPTDDWLVLELPDGRFCSLWAQGLPGTHGAAIAQGDYTGCHAVRETLTEILAEIQAADDAERRGWGVPQ